MLRLLLFQELIITCTMLIDLNSSKFYTVFWQENNRFWFYLLVNDDIIQKPVFFGLLNFDTLIVSDDINRIIFDWFLSWCINIFINPYFKNWVLAIYLESRIHSYRVAPVPLRSLSDIQIFFRVMINKQTINYILIMLSYIMLGFFES